MSCELGGTSGPKATHRLPPIPTTIESLPDSYS